MLFRGRRSPPALCQQFAPRRCRFRARRGRLLAAAAWPARSRTRICCCFNTFRRGHVRAEFSFTNLIIRHQFIRTNLPFGRWFRHIHFPYFRQLECSGIRSFRARTRANTNNSTFIRAAPVLTGMFCVDRAQKSLGFFVLACSRNHRCRWGC